MSSNPCPPDTMNLGKYQANCRGTHCCNLRCGNVHRNWMQGSRICGGKWGQRVILMTSTLDAADSWVRVRVQSKHMRETYLW